MALKGQIPWNKGKQLSEKHRHGLSLSHIGNRQTEDTKEKIALNNARYWLGKKRPEAKEWLIHFPKGNIPWNKGLAWERMRGENNPRWKGGVYLTARMASMATVEYKNWRRAVFARDDYRCMFCGERGIELQADHIYSWKEFPRLHYKLENGQTLCRNCHIKKTSYERTGMLAMI